MSKIHFGLFGKIFFYTIIFILLTISVFMIFFAQQLNTGIMMHQRMQVGARFQSLIEKLEGKTHSEMIAAAGEFHRRNESFDFFLRARDGTVIFQTSNFPEDEFNLNLRIISPQGANSSTVQRVHIASGRGLGGSLEPQIQILGIGGGGIGRRSGLVCVGHGHLVLSQERVGLAENPGFRKNPQGRRENCRYFRIVKKLLILPEDSSQHPRGALCCEKNALLKETPDHFRRQQHQDPGKNPFQDGHWQSVSECCAERGANHGSGCQAKHCG